MKTPIVVGAALLLTLGSAVASSFIYGQGRGAATRSEESVAAITPAAQQEVTPEMIAMWKATASSPHYAAPKLPI